MLLLLQLACLLLLPQCSCQLSSQLLLPSRGRCQLLVLHRDPRLLLPLLFAKLADLPEGLLTTATAGSTRCGSRGSAASVITPMPNAQLGRHRSAVNALHAFRCMWHAFAGTLWPAGCWQHPVGHKVPAT
jgi:hypothetical protein